MEVGSVSDQDQVCASPSARWGVFHDANEQLLQHNTLIVAEKPNLLHRPHNIRNRSLGQLFVRTFRTCMHLDIACRYILLRIKALKLSHFPPFDGPYGREINCTVYFFQLIC